MGHSRLGVLPATRKWAEVVGLIGGGSSAEAVATATMNAAEKALAKLVNDPALVQSVWLLAQIPVAARSDDFASALADIGVAVPNSNPTLADLMAGFTNAIDASVDGRRGRTDLGELAQMAAAETLAAVVAARTVGLFGERPDAVREKLAALNTEMQFGRLARDFFARFMGRFLNYYVSRELPLHVGPGRRFPTFQDQTRFNEALDLHCRQSSQIVERFAGGWHSKAQFENDLTPERTGKFVAYSLTKVRDELRMRSE